MEVIDDICLRCAHFEKPNGVGCRAFPDGIPFGYPPNNRHDLPFKNQTGNYVFSPVKEKEG
jgi:hypothetical protein